jgi:hypothetical protein
MREDDIVVLVLGLPLFLFVTFGMSGDLWAGLFSKKKD